ncbi:MAG: IPT/TIG domain-containing protein, partial [Patescibacteria group bacterium]|nr:IPT/TIG domain-containing protein [Patescibacteria group bacterium]
MFKSSKRIIIALTLLAGIFVMAGFALAQGPDLGLSYGNVTGLAATDPRLIVGNIIRIALGFLGVIALGLIIYGGFLWMTAAGNEERIATAKKVLISAIIGLIIILSAFAIATFILNSLLQATGLGGEGSPCSSSATSCVQDPTRCTVGTCDSTCHCNSHITPPIVNPPGPGEKCGGGALGSCGGVCAVGSSCNMATCLCETSGGTGTSCGTVTLGVCQQESVCDSANFCDTTNSDPAKLCTCQPRINDGGSCDASADTPGCQPLNLCVNNSACEFATCQCAPSNGVGDPCNATTTVGVCQPESNLCSNNLTCETKTPKACTCQEYPIINWVSPVGGFCANDHNNICSKDSDCPGSACDTNTPNGAQGNIISLGGQYFGDATGTVEFSNGAGSFVAGDLPKTVNPNCVSSWTAKQIIIVVPNGAKDGPIRVSTVDGKTDLSNDSRGPKIKDFVVNSITRPGLCQVTPEGKSGDSVFYNGVNFSTVASADFGSYNSAIQGVNSSFNPTAGETIVPNFNPGQTTTFVYNTDSKQNSNYLTFTNSSTPVIGAFISSFEPASGKVGQYVTIHGNGFGAIQGASQVYFGNAATGKPADFNFPAVCADSIWSDKQIIVKVPPGIDPNFNDILTVDLANGQTLTSAGATPQNFKVDETLSLKPSLCKISPVMGQPGSSVNLWGEYFDPFEEANSLVRFFHNQNVSGAANLANWDGNNIPNTVTATVPRDAASGPVTVVKNASSPANALEGNGLNFSVGSCLQAANQSTVCGSQFCCPAETYKAGTCVDNIAQDCVVTASTSVYEFKFSTTIAKGNPPTTPGSCQERSNIFGTCNSDLCPNSPGQCSLFAGGGILRDAGKKCDDAACDSQPGCANGACVYNATLNQCVDKNLALCGLDATTTDALGNKNIRTYCAAIKDPVTQATINNYIFDNAGNNSCPTGWIKGLKGSMPVCIDRGAGAGCIPCASDFTCVKSGLSGVCAAAGTICPSGSTCQSDGQCRQAAADSCSCCCRKANADQDCCAGLKCEGTCGTNTDPNDGAYGSCGGCATVGSSVAEHDAACNCTGSTGKFCDLNDSKFPDGVCRDCAALSDVTTCNQHNSSCCADRSTDNISCINRTFDSKGNKLPLVDTYYADVKYCGYYQ